MDLIQVVAQETQQSSPNKFDLDVLHVLYRTLTRYGYTADVSEVQMDATSIFRTVTIYTSFTTPLVSFEIGNRRLGRSARHLPLIRYEFSSFVNLGLPQQTAELFTNFLNDLMRERKKELERRRAGPGRYPPPTPRDDLSGRLPYIVQTLRYILESGTLASLGLSSLATEAVDYSPHAIEIYGTISPTQKVNFRPNLAADFPLAGSFSGVQVQFSKTGLYFFKNQYNYGRQGDVLLAESYPDISIQQFSVPWSAIDTEVVLIQTHWPSVLSFAERLFRGETIDFAHESDILTAFTLLTSHLGTTDKKVSVTSPHAIFAPLPAVDATTVVQNIASVLACAAQD